MKSTLGEEKTQIALMILKVLKTSVGGILFCGFGSWIFAKATNSITQIMIFPFMICGGAVLVNGIITVLQGFNMNKFIKNIEKNTDVSTENIEKIQDNLNNAKIWTNKFYLIGFSIFWFVFLIVIDYFAIKNWSENGSILFIFLLIFWILGIFMIKSKWKNK